MSYLPDIFYNFNPYEYYVEVAELTKREQTKEIIDLTNRLELEFFKYVSDFNSMDFQEQDFFEKHILFAFIPYYNELSNYDKFKVLTRYISYFSEHDNYLVSTFREILNQFQRDNTITVSQVKKELGENYFKQIDPSCLFMLDPEYNDYTYLDQFLNQYFEQQVYYVKEHLDLNIFEGNRKELIPHLLFKIVPTNYFSLTSEHVKQVISYITNFVNNKVKKGIKVVSKLCIYIDSINHSFTIDQVTTPSLTIDETLKLFKTFKSLETLNSHTTFKFYLNKKEVTEEFTRGVVKVPIKVRDSLPDYFQYTLINLTVAQKGEVDTYKKLFKHDKGYNHYVSYYKEKLKNYFNQVSLIDFNVEDFEHIKESTYETNYI